MLATIENMAKFAGSNDRTVLAYSPRTGEEYSADAADYFNAPAGLRPGWVMLDSEGEPMELVRRRAEMVPVQDDPA